MPTKEAHVMATPSSATDTDRVPKLPVVWRVAAWTGITGLLALGFLGYFSPSMRLNWDAIAAMCGF